MWQSPGFKAKSDILPGRVVLIDGEFEVKAVSTAAEANSPKIIGISATLRRRPQGFADSDKAAVAGEAIRVFTNGEIALAHAQAAISAGDKLIAHSDGRVKPLPPNPPAGDYVIVGTALHNAAADDYVRVLVSVYEKKVT